MKKTSIIFIVLYWVLVGPLAVAQSEGAGTKTEQAPSVKTNITEEFCRDFDFSSGFPKSIFGAFGKNYYRIDMGFDSIEKKDGCTYSIKGSTTLKFKKVSFIGELKITKVVKQPGSMWNENDPNLFMCRAYADYTFTEDQTTSGSGVFKGNFDVLFNITKDNKIYWDEEFALIDGYDNFRFDGQWISPKGNTYQAYFADGRLIVGDLNGGAGEFVPNEKYLEYGWWDYAWMYHANDTALVERMRESKAAAIKAYKESQKKN